MSRPHFVMRCCIADGRFSRGLICRSALQPLCMLDILPFLCAMLSLLLCSDFLVAAVQHVLQVLPLFLQGVQIADLSVSRGDPSCQQQT